MRDAHSGENAFVIGESNQRPKKNATGEVPVARQGEKLPEAGVAHGWRTWASADFDPDRSAIGAETAGPKLCSLDFPIGTLEKTPVLTGQTSSRTNRLALNRKQKGARSLDYMGPGNRLAAASGCSPSFFPHRRPIMRGPSGRRASACGDRRIHQFWRFPEETSPSDLAEGNARSPFSGPVNLALTLAFALSRNALQACHRGMAAEADAGGTNPTIEPNLPPVTLGA